MLWEQPSLRLPLNLQAQVKSLQLVLLRHELVPAELALQSLEPFLPQWLALLLLRRLARALEWCVAPQQRRALAPLLLQGYDLRSVVSDRTIPPTHTIAVVLLALSSTPWKQGLHPLECRVRCCSHSHQGFQPFSDILPIRHRITGKPHILTSHRLMDVNVPRYKLHQDLPVWSKGLDVDVSGRDAQCEHVQVLHELVQYTQVRELLVVDLDLARFLDATELEPLLHHHKWLLSYLGQ